MAPEVEFEAVDPNDLNFKSEIRNLRSSIPPPGPPHTTPFKQLQTPSTKKLHVQLGEMERVQKHGRRPRCEADPEGQSND